MTVTQQTDALIVGAGPIGLFTVFQLGLQGIRADVVDVLDHAGGQCVELYADKPIYDIPALAVCSGQELTDRLLQQISPFAPRWHWGQQVSSVQRQADGRWLVQTTRGHTELQRFLCRSLFIAAGVGAFVPKPLPIPELATFEGRQLFYRLAAAKRLAGRRVVVVGGDHDAVTAALSLARSGAQQAASVTLVHRRDVLQADEAALTELAQLRQSGRIQFVAGQITGFEHSGADPDARLTRLLIDTPEGTTLSLELDDVLVCLGISPKLGPISDWGLAMQRKQLLVDAATCATSEAGIYAVGDIVHYPGKKKLIVSGFHEATQAAFAAAAQLQPDQAEVLHYTTSSRLLQQRLGLLPPG